MRRRSGHRGTRGSRHEVRERRQYTGVGSTQSGSGVCRGRGRCSRVADEVALGPALCCAVSAGEDPPFPGCREVPPGPRGWSAGVFRHCSRDLPWGAHGGRTRRVESVLYRCVWSKGTLGGGRRGRGGGGEGGGGAAAVTRRAAHSFYPRGRADADADAAQQAAGRHGGGERAGGVSASP